MNPSKLTYPSQAAEDAVEKFIVDHIKAYSIQNEPCWRIKWRGELIKTTSGKSSWRTIGHAKSAFKNHISRCSLAYWYERHLTGNDKLRCYEGKISQDEFYKIIEPEIEYIPA